MEKKYSGGRILRIWEWKDGMVSVEIEDTRILLTKDRFKSLKKDIEELAKEIEESKRIKDYIG